MYYSIVLPSEGGKPMIKTYDSMMVLAEGGGGAKYDN